MTDTPLPDGLMTMIKTATRALIMACAAPGQTGPERVEQLTGYSRGQISKWQSDQYPDVIPTHVLFVLSHTVQCTVFARTLAALVNHRVVPITDGSAPGGDLIHDVMRMTGSLGRFNGDATEALSDNQVTRSEGMQLIKALLAHQDEVTATVQRLARIVEGEAPTKV